MSLRQLVPVYLSNGLSCSLAFHVFYPSLALLTVQVRVSHDVFCSFLKRWHSLDHLDEQVT